MPTLAQIQSVRNQIADLGAQWGKASALEKAVLHNRALVIGGQVGASYNSSTGVWTYPTPDVEKNHPVQSNTFIDNSVTTTPTGIVKASTAAVVSEIDRRRKVVSGLIFSNDPGVAAIQQKSADIYITTGSWSSPEQIEYHKQAEDLRKSLNPMYQGSPYGPDTQAKEDATILPTKQFVVANGFESTLSEIKTNPGGAINGALKVGFGLAATFLIVSLFRGKSR